MKNIAIIGANFGIRGYWPALKDNKNYKISLICCQSNEKYKELSSKFKKIRISQNWKDAFKKNIDIIICSTLPKIQEKIIDYNFKKKKQIIFEKPLSTSYKKSKLLLKRIIKSRIKSQVNLTFLNHNLFIILKKIIDSNKFGKIKNFYIYWNLKNKSLVDKKYSWKIDEKKGGGVKNIYLIHVLSYCLFFFKKFKIIKKKVKTIKLFKKNIISGVDFKIQINKNLIGDFKLNCLSKKHQIHKLFFLFSKASIKLINNSKDWTKNFKLVINYNNKKKIILDKNNYHDGRSKQISNLFRKFKKDNNNYNDIQKCVESEKLISKI